MNSSFEYISNLQYLLKAAGEQLEAFKSGEKYVQMELNHKKIIQSYEKDIRSLKREVEKMEQRALKAEGERDSLKDKVTEQRQEIYRLQTELEEERGKNQKLTAQKRPNRSKKNLYKGLFHHQ